MTDKAQLTNSLKAWQSLREIVSQKKLTHLKKDRTAWQHRLKLLEHSKSHWDQYNHLKQLKHLIAQAHPRCVKICLPILSQMLSMTHYIEDLIHLAVPIDQSLHSFKQQILDLKRAHRTLSMCRIIRCYCCKNSILCLKLKRLNQELNAYIKIVEHLQEGLSDEGILVQDLYEQLAMMRQKHDEILQISDINLTCIDQYERQIDVCKQARSLALELQEELPWITLKENMRYGFTVCLFVLQLFFWIGTAVWPSSIHSATLIHDVDGILWMDIGLGLWADAGTSVLESGMVQLDSKSIVCLVMGLAILGVSFLDWTVFWGWITPISLCVSGVRIVNMPCFENNT